MQRQSRHTGRLSRSIPRCVCFQPCDQLAQCRPRDEEWQTALVNANIRDEKLNDLVQGRLLISDVCQVVDIVQLGVLTSQPF